MVLSKIENLTSVSNPVAKIGHGSNLLYTYNNIFFERTHNSGSMNFIFGADPYSVLHIPRLLNLNLKLKKTSLASLVANPIQFYQHVDSPKLILFSY